MDFTDPRDLNLLGDHEVSVRSRITQISTGIVSTYFGRTVTVTLRDPCVSTTLLSSQTITSTIVLPLGFDFVEDLFILQDAVNNDFGNGENICGSQTLSISVGSDYASIANNQLIVVTSDAAFLGSR